MNLRDLVQLGETVAGRFRVESHAGTGGMGAVYRAIDTTTGTPVALKVLFPQRVDEIARFTRESALLRQLDHPSIVRYVAHGALPAGSPYLVMEWVEGETLAGILESGPLDVARSLEVALAVAQALVHAHGHGVIHRDIKPRNVMLTPEGLVKVLDFGIARVSRDTATALTKTGMFLGTPGYIAPEQARGLPDVDARADVFSLGCVLFETLTGRAAFVAREAIALLAKLVIEDVPPPSTVQPGIPAAVDALVGRMLVKNPAERIASAAAVVDGIEALLSETERHDSGGPRRLTATELRLLAVVLSVGEGESTITSTAIRTHDTQPGLSLIEELTLLGVRLERLADGSVFCLVVGDDVATDLATRAARCGLALKRHRAARPVVISTGRGLVTERIPVGDVIDRAAIMLRATLPDEAWIPIDPLTAGLLDSTFEVRGRDGGLYLVREREPLHVRRRLLGKEQPFLGRERDLDYLASLFEECAEERTSTAALVTGNAGLGKSRLLSELLDRIHQAQPTTSVLVARGDPLTAQSPFALLGQWVRRAAALHDDEPRDVRRLKLRARVMRHLPEDQIDEITDFLGEVAAVRLPHDRARVESARADPALMRQEIERAWQAFLSAEAAAGPLVLVLEDLHWGDLPSVKMVERSLRALPDSPLFVLAAARPGVETLFPSLIESAGVHQVHLAKLSRSASKNLVRAALGASVPAERVDGLVARADGNPFYLEELIRAVAETSSDELPDTLVAMVNERLHALDSEARRVLRAASVLGETFWVGGLQAILGEVSSASVAVVEQWLRTLTREEIVDARPSSRFQGHDELGFRHALLREAAYASLPDADRAAAHLAAARWLESVGEADTRRLAEHFERGGARERAGELHATAARQALEADDLEAAMASAARGVALEPGGELLGRLRIVQGEVHALRGENVEAERCGSEVLELVPRGSESWAWAVAMTLVVRIQLGETESADALAEALIAEAPQVPAAALARATAAVVPYLAHAGRVTYARALIAAAESAPGARGTLDAAGGAWLHLTRARLALIADADPFTALLALGRSATAFHGAVSGLGTVASEVVRGEALVALGLFEDARARLDPIIELAERMGAGSYAARARVHAGLARVGAAAHEATTGRGEAAAGRVQIAAAVESFYRQGNSTDYALARIALARAALLAGEPADALREAEEVSFTTFPTPFIRAAALTVLGQAHRARGELVPAGAALAEAEALLDAEAPSHTELQLGRAEIAHAMGDTDGARAIALAAVARIAQVSAGAPPTEAHAWRALAPHARLAHMAGAAALD